MGFLLSSAHAAPWDRESTDYDIERAWFDEQTIYFKVHRKYSRVSPFSLSLRGKVVETRDDFSIVTLPRTAVSATPSALRLDAGEPAEGIEYRDNDFQISATDQHFTVAGRETTTELPDCAWQVWRDMGIVRRADGLLFCGVFFDTAGHVEWRLDPLLVDALQRKLGAFNQRRPGVIAVAAPTLVPVFAAGKLMITTDWTSIHPEAVLVATLDPAVGSEPAYASSAMAAASGYFGLASGRKVYNPNGGFIVDNDPRGAGALAFCDLAGCAVLPPPARFSYLLVDAAQRIAYVLEGAGAAVPERRIWTLRWGQYMANPPPLAAPGGQATVR